MPHDSLAAHSGSLSFEERSVLLHLANGASVRSGPQVFDRLIEDVTQLFACSAAWLATTRADGQLSTIAVKALGEWQASVEYSPERAPCSLVLQQCRVIRLEQANVGQHVLPELNLAHATRYLGAPLLDSQGDALGVLALLSDAPFPDDERAAAALQLFAERATAELRHQAAEHSARARTAELSGLFAGVLDAVLSLDADLHVVALNPAARELFGATDGEQLDLSRLLTDASVDRLRRAARDLDRSAVTSNSVWLAGGLQGKRRHQVFSAEAMLSSYATESNRAFNLILRNVEAQRQAEARIVALTREAEYLRDRAESPEKAERIVGGSSSVQRARHEIERAASLQSCVLLLGEAGTGKELFARTLHDLSRRAQRPFVRFSCTGASSESLARSLFGDERSEGRVRLAATGTLLLDEVADFPLELQPQLLRLLELGEFETVGSSRTHSVELRVVATTRRNLARAVADGSFRQDLYYRLSVFPIELPPLRERGRDVDELAQMFLDRFAHSAGVSFSPLPEVSLERLRHYPWPGNVRELRAVIERGALISTPPNFDIDQALPERRNEVAELDDLAASIQSEHSLIALKRENILRALEKTRWKVAGESGAAALLGLNASTLNSRLRALGIRRPSR